MRAIIIPFVCAVMMSVCSVTVFAQDAKFSAHPLETEDGWNLEISYYNKALEKGDQGTGITKPVVVLLPGDKGNRLNWEGSNGFAEQLKEKGYAVVTVDVRKYGKSTPPAGTKNVIKKVLPKDYANIVQYDLEAVKNFLFEEHQKKNLNMAKLGIIAPESLAPIATAFAVRDWKKIPYKDAAIFEHRTPRGQDVKALVLISPKMNLGGFPGNRATMAIRNPDYNVAIFTCAGATDEAGLKQANKLYRLLDGRAKPDPDAASIYSKEIFPGLGQRGTELLKRNNGIMESSIIGFLDKNLSQKSIEWRDRRSRYER